MGLIGSSCVLCSVGLSATTMVSAGSETRAASALSESGASFSNFAARELSFFFICRGLSDGWSLKGRAISARPVARLQGSLGLVSTGADFVP